MKDLKEKRYKIYDTLCTWRLIVKIQKMIKILNNKNITKILNNEKSIKIILRSGKNGSKWKI